MEVAGKATEKAKESLKGYISGQRFLITQLRARGYSDDIANEITEIYDDMVSLAKKHAVALDVLYEYADFLRVFRRYEEGLIIALKLERCRDYYGHIDGVDSSELYLLIGQLYYGLADFDSALKYYERSLEEKKAATVVDSEMITKVALEIAALSWKRGEFEKAKQALDKLVSDLQQ